MSRGREERELGERGERERGRGKGQNFTAEKRDEPESSRGFKGHLAMWGGCCLLRTPQQHTGQST